jgi:DNA repair protein RecO (recombination protein O)
MSQTYNTQGIVLSRKDFSENDRLITLLTPHFGIIKAVAPGAKKYRSSLRGRLELFVVNDLMLVKGKSIDRIVQAQTIQSFAKLSGDLGKLSAAQYLAELILCIGLSEQPQVELYELCLEHLSRFSDTVIPTLLIPHLTQAVFHLLTIAGVSPTVDRCCLTEEIITPDYSISENYLGFSFSNGGIFKIGSSNIGFEAKLGSIELSLLQYLREPHLPEQQLSHSYTTWCKIEKILREYAQFHFNYSFRSSLLINSLSQREFIQTK